MEVREVAARHKHDSNLLSCLRSTLDRHTRVPVLTRISRLPAITICTTFSHLPRFYVAGLVDGRHNRAKSPIRKSLLKKAWGRHREVLSPRYRARRADRMGKLAHLCMREDSSSVAEGPPVYLNLKPLSARGELWYIFFGIRHFVSYAFMQTINKAQCSSYLYLCPRTDCPSFVRTLTEKNNDGRGSGNCSGTGLYKWKLWFFGTGENRLQRTTTERSGELSYSRIQIKVCYSIHASPRIYRIWTGAIWN